jgi:hypothetical protein
MRAHLSLSLSLCVWLVLVPVLTADGVDRGRSAAERQDTLPARAPLQRQVRRSNPSTHPPTRPPIHVDAPTS